MIKAATLFSGGGLVDLAFEKSNIPVVWGVEKDNAIASCYRKNFPDSSLLESDIRNLDIKKLTPVDFIHASPPCQAHSIAWNSSNAPHTEEDVGSYIVPIIDAMKPTYFTLENVPLYRKTHTFNYISNYLKNNNYYCYISIINASNHGVPQDRKRLILMASKETFFPYMSQICHGGWYKAIADLIPEMEIVELNNTQKNIIKNNQLKLPLLIPRVGSSRSVIPRKASDPAPTIRAFGKCRAGDHWANIITEEGSVKKISPEATARLMSVFNYHLPTNKQLAQKILGNGIPPLLMELVIDCVIGKSTFFYNIS